jgi:mono/diheme cytochrome c family protein
MRASTIGYLALTIILGGCGSIAAPEAPSSSIQSPDAALLERGRQVAEYRCASCHSITRGVSSRVAAAPPFETLYVRIPPERLGERIRDGLMVDHPSMPLLVRLSPDEEAALEAYMTSVQGR